MGGASLFGNTNMRTRKTELNIKLVETAIPEEVIQELAAALKIDTASAVDLIMFMHRELREHR
jgi:hypothetical protein